MKEISNSLTFALLGGGDTTVWTPPCGFREWQENGGAQRRRFSLPTFTYWNQIIMQEHFQLNIGFNFFFNTTLLKLLIVLEIISKYHFAHMTVFLPIGRYMRGVQSYMVAWA